jgi:hypothetical protein
MKSLKILILMLPLFVFACKSDRKQLLPGTWKVEKWVNGGVDSFFLKAQMYIDTMGKGHDDATNIAIYGTANMDSMRTVLQHQYEQAKALQEEAMKNAVFTFRKDGTADVTLAGKKNTGKWVMDNENGLILEEGGFGEQNVMSKYNIVALSDKELTLRFYEEGDSSTVTFRREGK